MKAVEGQGSGMNFMFLSKRLSEEFLTWNKIDNSKNVKFKIGSSI